MGAMWADGLLYHNVSHMAREGYFYYQTNVNVYVRVCGMKKMREALRECV